MSVCIIKEFVDRPSVNQMLVLTRHFPVIRVEDYSNPTDHSTEHIRIPFCGHILMLIIEEEVVACRSDRYA